MIDVFAVQNKVCGLDVKTLNKILGVPHPLLAAAAQRPDWPRRSVLDSIGPFQVRRQIEVHVHVHVREDAVGE